MKKRVSLVSILFTSLLLSACGGGGGEKSTSLADLTGVWDMSSTEGQLIDESYTVINANGAGSDYDYLGDTFDNYLNCYEKSDYSLENLGDDNFQFTNSENTGELNISVAGDKITFVIGSETFTGTRSVRVETDFEPICTFESQ